MTNETSTRYSPRNDTFGYDAMGNPTSWKGSTRSFNANNQEITGGSSQFSYDGNGNATTYKGNTLTFDEENHMTSFTTPSGSTPLRAVYRSDGLRAWKQVSSGNRYFFLYDGDQIVCGFNGNGDLSRINVWGASGLIGRQSGTNGGTPVYDYAWDDKGNISQVLNTNSSVASNYLVSAWGEASTDSAAYDPYRCMGGEFGNYFDAETGLILCGQRYYDPSGGRWLTRDPIEYDGGLNLYGYVENNPTNFVDPDGLEGAPPLPPGEIAAENGWKIVHWQDGKNPAAHGSHLHLTRGGWKISIDAQGNPLRGPSQRAWSKLKISEQKVARKFLQKNCDKIAKASAQLEAYLEWRAGATGAGRVVAGAGKVAAGVGKVAKVVVPVLDLLLILDMLAKPAGAGSDMPRYPSSNPRPRSRPRPGPQRTDDE